MTIQINGTDIPVPDDARVTLLDLLREDLHLTGTKVGCKQGACGACTVMLDGVRVLSCLTLAAQADGRSATTIEGLGDSESPHPMQVAFVETDGFQCGYCTPGQICSAVAMLRELDSGMPSYVTADLSSEKVAVSREEIQERMSGNLCRCGAHNGIIEAILQVAQEEAE